MINIYKFNNLFLKLDTSIDIEKEIKDYFSCYIDNKWFNPLVKMKKWDGKVSFYNIRTSLLPIGFFKEFQKFCIKNEYRYEIKFDINEIKNDISISTLDEFLKRLFVDSKFKLRDYQDEAFKTAIKNKNGVLLSATGSGKSLVIFCLIRFILLLKKEILLVVPTTNLVLQMLSDFKEYGWEDADKYICALFSGREYEISKPVLICTWQTLQNKDEEFFQRFQGLLVDECFHPDSLVRMGDNSQKRIENIKVGDIVQSYNFKANLIENKKVTKIYKKKMKKMKKLYRIEDNLGDIYFDKGITKNHNIFIMKSKKKIEKLKKGDKILINRSI